MAVCGVCLVLLVMVAGSVQGQGDGLFFNDVMVNHGIVTREDIGTSESNAVQCRTTVADCCTDSDANTGQWFFPSGSMITTDTSRDIYQVMGQNYVGLQRNQDGSEGIYRCEIGLTGSEVTYYVGVYSSGNGEVTISDPIGFNLDNAATPMFTLTCTSTGGPATTVTWTLDGAMISDDSSHDFSQTVTDQSTATYSNTLTVTGREPGTYQCSVSNARGTVTQSLTVEAADPPTDVSAEQDGSTITVSWTPPTTGATPTGYVIYYQTTDDQGSLMVDSGSATSATVTSRREDRVYTITMVTTSTTLPSTETTAVTAIRPAAYIELDSRVLPDHSLVTLPEIGTTGITGLRCVTARTDCCAGVTDRDISEWFDPSGGLANDMISTFNRTRRGEVPPDPLGYVQLRRSSNSATLSTADEGIYSCIIPEPGTDPNPDIVTFYVGIYNTGRGRPSISGDITFDQPDPQVAMFTLTCTSTGGPATTVTWTLDDSPVPEDGDHSFSQTLVNAVTGGYSSTLTVTGIKPGDYQCNVSNAGGSATSPVFTGTAPPAPTITSDNSVVDSTSVQLSWSAVTSITPVLKYQVSYQRTGSVGPMGCDFDDSGIEDVDSGVTEYTLTGLEEFSTYDVTVTAVNVFGPSEQSGPVQITTDPSAPSAGPDGVEATAQDDGSIVVTWNEVPCLEQNSEITQYIVEYSEAVDAPTQSLTIMGLSSDTQYSIRVAAVNRAGEMGPFSDAVTAEMTASAQQTSSVTVLVGAVVGSILGTVVVYTAVLGAVILLFWKRNRSYTLNATGHTIAMKECSAYGDIPVQPSAVSGEEPIYEN